MGRYDSGLFTLKEFYNRGVIKIAPDVLVYIGGALETAVIAPALGNNSNLSFNDGITTVSVQNNVDPPGTSSASIEITTPVYGERSRYWVYFPTGIGGTVTRAPLFVPMMEVKIFFKGRFLKQDGQPWYYPAFWGFIHAVEENYNGGVYKINLQCADVLHWWSYSKINVHPIPESNIAAGGGQSITAYTTIFQRANPYKILHRLNTLMGMHEFVTPVWAGQKTPLDSQYPRPDWRKNTTAIMDYWREKFKHSGSLLKMYGLNGKRVNAEGKQTTQPNQYGPDVSGNSQVMKAIQSQDNFDYSLDLGFIEKFETFANYEEWGNFDQPTYMTKLEMATNIKTITDFEFFQDVDGCFVFKPPFFNLNVKGIQPYTILPSDIISFSSSTETENIVTVFSLSTYLDPHIRTTPFGMGKGFHMDLDLCKKYGIRHQELTIQYVKDAKLAGTLAVAMMNVQNAKAVVGSVTIPGRPEIRLGYPIYIEHRDSFHYVKSINHSFDFGGSFSTTLSLETERRKVLDLDDGTVMKDIVYRLSGPAPKPQNTKGDKKETVPPIYPNNTLEEVKRQDINYTEGRIFSINQGRYDLSKRKTLKEVSVTQTTVPFTDVDGYKVIGAFPYGRNLNAIAVVTDKEELPVLKDVYLATMARPLYKSESKNMDIIDVANNPGTSFDGSIPVSFKKPKQILGEFLKDDPKNVDSDTSIPDAGKVTYTSTIGNQTVSTKLLASAGK